MAALLPVADALARVVDGAAALPAESVPLAEARGRVLAAPLVALRDQPPFDASAMDGYAVRAADAAVGARLTLIGASAAGHGFSGRVETGQAVRIFTGAPVPPGADAILIQEDADADGEAVVVREAPRPRRYIRPRGFDFAEGAEPFAAGRRLRPRDLGLAAAMGLGAVDAVRRPRVAVLATGDELVPAGAMPGPDQIVASSTVAVAGFVAAEGGVAIDLGIAVDRIEALRAAIAAARDAEADVLVTLGGASVGDHDLVREAFAAEGAALDFWRIAMRPGKPMMFGRLGGMRLLGMPGNPVSTQVCSILFLRPLLRRLLGRTDAANLLEDGVLGRDLAANDEREDYLRARLEAGADGVTATPFEKQDSSLMYPLALADALVVRAPHAPAAPRGARCRFIRLGPDD